MRCHEKDKYAKIDKINLCALICCECRMSAGRAAMWYSEKSFHSFRCRRHRATLTTRNSSFVLIKMDGVGARSLHLFFFFLILRGQVKSSRVESFTFMWTAMLQIHVFLMRPSLAILMLCVCKRSPHKTFTSHFNGRVLRLNTFNFFSPSKSINTGRQEIVVEVWITIRKKITSGHWQNMYFSDGGRDLINYSIQLHDVFRKFWWFFNFLLFLFYASHKRDNRADVAMIQSLAWTGGQCLLPMIFWWVREWQYFFLMSTLPLALFLFVPK